MITEELTSLMMSFLGIVSLVCLTAIIIEFLKTIQKEDDVYLNKIKQEDSEDKDS